MSYHPEGLLKTVTRNGVVEESLWYDPSGKLMYRRSGTTVWYYVGEQATVTAQLTVTCATDWCAPDPSSVRVNVHVLLGGARIATVRTSPGQTADQALGNVLYHHRDRQGSVVATTVTGGQVGVQYRYGPYGEVDEVSGNEAWAGSDLGYTGGLNLSGTLLHLQARVYDSGLRRFLQADAVDPLQFTYVEGDPANMVDPSGRAANTYPASSTAQRIGDAVIVTYYDANGHKIGEDVFWLTDEQDLQRLKATQVPTGYIQKNISLGEGSYQPVRFRIGPELLSRLVNPNIEMRLPADPSGLGPEWTLDSAHKHPHGERYRDPDGRTLDFHKGRPGELGWKGKDHWHDNGDKEHLPPGTEVPDPAPLPAVAPDVPGNAGKALVGGVAIIGGGYLIYRAVRMIPSLFPPPWWTIPANAAVP